ncbi:hypothetical protein GN244_ATG20821 [Phytophthora infestans]|uniref:Transmembrane protein n=1 Tax=Phytophthora infestans TaxID=4787 RepID=A0A833W3T4_PHYIN|nr:hypothetical protein GN244_ATG20821 [Phytophthora infestans]
MDKIWSVAFFSVACLGLYEADFVSDLLHAPHANRSFVHLGIFMILGERVHYETAKTATHGMLVSVLASGFFFGMWSWGVVVQLLVILPPVLQRIVFVAAYLWFMHSYTVSMGHGSRGSTRRRLDAMMQILQQATTSDRATNLRLTWHLWHTGCLQTPQLRCEARTNFDMAGFFHTRNTDPKAFSVGKTRVDQNFLVLVVET